jgi:hypothetical protein
MLKRLFLIVNFNYCLIQKSKIKVMKYFVLLAAPVMLSMHSYAQSNRNAVHKLTDKYVARQDVPFAAQANVNQTVSANAKLVNPHQNSVATYSYFSTCINAIGFTAEDNNQLSYNPELNCLAQFQRHTSQWPNSAFTPTPGLGRTGYQVVKFTTNGGATWDSVNYYQNETYWGRYPSGVIFNPDGNSNLGSAWFVGNGPCTGSGSTWWANWFASVQVPTGAMPRTVQTNDQQPTPTDVQSSVSFRTYFSPYSTTIGGQGANKTVFTGARKLTDVPVSSSLTGIYGVAIFKGVFNGTNGFTWTQDSSFTNHWHMGGNNAQVGTPHIAFSPDGLTGYILINGGDSLASPPMTSYQPLLWKTTDGGATWNRVNQNYDWITNHPEILVNLRPTVVGGYQLPAFYDNFGSGVTVDNTGTLHYATALSPGTSADPDSLGYNYFYPYSYEYQTCDHPFIWDFTTNGNGSWSTAKVGELYTRDLGADQQSDSNYTFNHWKDNTGAYLSYTNHIRVLRSADGSKIFYTWADGDSSVANMLDVYDGNTLIYKAGGPMVDPDIHYRGLDVANGMWTQEYINKAADNSLSGGYWFYFSSDVAMTTGSGYTIPMTYIDSKDGTFNSGNPVVVYYLNDANIASGDFTMAGTTQCAEAVGIKEVVAGNVSGVSQNFPNPFNNTSAVKVNLNKAGDITLNVTNSIGQVVSTQTVKGVAGENTLTIDASSLNSGIYFYSVISGNSKVTRMMSVAK